MSIKNKEDEGNDGEMTFLEHLEALRWHLIRSIIAIGIFTVIAFLFKRFIFDAIIFAPSKASFPTYRLLCHLSQMFSSPKLCIDKLNLKLINIELAAQFLIHLKVSFISGLVVAFPYVFWEIWRFIRPALYDSEVHYARGVVFFSSILFMIGVCFGYFILTPFALNFFSSYTVSTEVQNSFTFTNYIGFLTMFILVSGIIFELPIVVYFLSKVGLLTPSFMRKYRKHALVIILFVSAVVTPADVGTQILVAVPVYFLYELSIFISAAVVRNREAILDE